jgi:methylmalonyl-CoA mutase cobalamin-binding subunit
VIVTSPSDRHARHMLDALMAGNSHRAQSVASEAFESGLGLLELFDDVLSPALCLVGERWQEGLVRHTQERIATAAAESLLDRLAERQDESAPVWLAATTEGDHHRVGVRMAAATLVSSGLRAHTAFERSVADLVAEAAGASGVCLSCSGPWCVVNAREAAERIAATGTPVLLGGGGWAGWQDPPAITQVGSMGALAAMVSPRALQPS